MAFQAMPGIFSRDGLCSMDAMRLQLPGADESQTKVVLERPERPLKTVLWGLSKSFVLCTKPIPL